MNKIVICIPTYKRPLLLKKLVLSISKNEIDKTIIRPVPILIVDNDSEKSAKVISDELRTISLDGFKVLYYNYPVKGLSNVRNELFKRALKLKPDYIVSIDDDEFVSSRWLNQLLLTIVENKGDIALGPVIPAFEKRTPKYISYWFEEYDFLNNQKVNYYKSGNYIICTKFLIKYNLKFDERFNTSGGEDSYFGLTAMNKGARIYWAKEAIAYEGIPDSRTKTSWLIERSYRGAINFVRRMKLEKQKFKLLKKVIISLFYIIVGVIGIIALLLPIKKRLFGILKLSEGIGGFAGILNIKYDGY